MGPLRRRRGCRDPELTRSPRSVGGVVGAGAAPSRLRALLGLGLAALGAAVFTPAFTPPAEGAQKLPSLPALPLAPGGDRLVIRTSARVELLQLATALSQQGAISLNSPLKADAFANVGRLAGHAALDALRELERNGLGPADWAALVLAHGEPPRLSPDRPVDRWLHPWGEGLGERERDRLLERAGDTLGDFWDTAELGRFFATHLEAYEGIEAALATALPRGEPLVELDRRTGITGPAVLLVPSPLAERDVLLSLPETPEAQATLVRITALPEGQLPASPVRQAALRYEAVAHARLRALFDTFDAEIAQTARALADARSGAPVEGIGLSLGSSDVVSSTRVEQAVVRALFHQYIKDDAGWLAEARQDALRGGVPGVAAIEQALAEADTRPDVYPSLHTQLPTLLEAAIQDAVARSLPPRPPGDFEVWEGALPVGWTIQAASSPRGDAVPTRIERLPLGAPNRRGAPAEGWALRLRAAPETNEWLEVLSDPVAVLPGDKVTLHARVRTEGADPIPGLILGAYVEVVLRGPSGVKVSQVKGRSVVGTTPWQDVEVPIDIPAGTQSVQVGLGLGLPGVADFDDVRFEITRPPARYLLSHGDFEVATGQAPWGWERQLSAQNAVVGPTVESEWILDGAQFIQGRSSLKLRGGAQTNRWYTLRSEPVLSRPGRRVTLTGYLKATDIRREGLQARNANLMVEFLDARGAVITAEISPVTEGTTPWTPVRLEATAPLGTVWVRVGCLLSMSGELWVDDLHLAQR